MLLAGRQEGHLACKNWCWRAYLSAARCRLAYAAADATATHFLHIGFTFLVPAHLGSPGKRAIKRVYVCISKQSTESVESVLKKKAMEAWSERVWE